MTAQKNSISEQTTPPGTVTWRAFRPEMVVDAGGCQRVISCAVVSRRRRLDVVVTALVSDVKKASTVHSCDVPAPPTEYVAKEDGAKVKSKITAGVNDPS